MMPAIRVDKLSKRYILGPRLSRYRTLRESLVDSALAPIRFLRRHATSFVNGQTASWKKSNKDFFALKDVSFTVERGDVVGIIGCNGAGKSTLLKILSRITEPTAGRVELFGRVGSLLEVGTGFHPELTGRENIFLNGAILGMTRREIHNKFDEIVDFSEINLFLDTPVKHYSSGMYIRLAFAVAAHMNVEILVVDEVLAVGDLAFQKKCMQKMHEVGRNGRTVLFVSHNLGSLKTLCNKGITLDQGQLIGHGSIDNQIALYLARLSERATAPLRSRMDREGTGMARFVYVHFQDHLKNRITHTLSGAFLKVILGYEFSIPAARIDNVSLSFWSQDGQKIFHVDNGQTGHTFHQSMQSGEIHCVFRKLPLPPGMYTINALITVSHRIADHVFSVATLDVQSGDFFGTGKPAQSSGGQVYIDHDWEESAAHDGPPLTHSAK